jgi:hypothetical protein
VSWSRGCSGEAADADALEKSQREKRQSLILCDAVDPKDLRQSKESLKISELFTLVTDILCSVTSVFQALLFPVFEFFTAPADAPVTRPTQAAQTTQALQAI